jgi:hypothetical protein
VVTAQAVPRVGQIDAVPDGGALTTFWTEEKANERAKCLKI